MFIDMENFAYTLASELMAMCKPYVQLYRKGNMKASIDVVQVEEDYCDVVIATPYASFTNQRGRMAGWVERTLLNVVSSFSPANDSEELSELLGTITYGG